MIANSTKTVGELSAELAGAARIFESFGIDYCCGGNRPLNIVCAELGISLEKVIDMLEQPQRESDFIDWRNRSLTELINYIMDKHHVFTRNELARIAVLFEKVITAHGEKHPELIQLHYLFRLLNDELLPHMIKEEKILFPYIMAIEKINNSDTAIPSICFDTVMHPVQRMMSEHDAAGDLLLEIRTISGEFNLPIDACQSFKILYQSLSNLEQDLHKHIHLENNILFPQAIEVEKKTRA